MELVKLCGEKGDVPRCVCRNCRNWETLENAPLKDICSWKDFFHKDKGEAVAIAMTAILIAVLITSLIILK